MPRLFKRKEFAFYAGEDQIIEDLATQLKVPQVTVVSQALKLLQQQLEKKSLSV